MRVIIDAEMPGPPIIDRLLLRGFLSFLLVTVVGAVFVGLVARLFFGAWVGGTFYVGPLVAILAIVYRQRRIAN